MSTRLEPPASNSVDALESSCISRARRPPGVAALYEDDTHLVVAWRDLAAGGGASGSAASSGSAAGGGASGSAASSGSAAGGVAAANAASKIYDPSAVKAALATGMIDAKRVGLVGHSWGGYEASFIPTPTNIFAASIAGGPGSRSSCWSTLTRTTARRKSRTRSITIGESSSGSATA